MDYWLYDIPGCKAISIAHWTSIYCTHIRFRIRSSTWGSWVSGYLKDSNRLLIVMKCGPRYWVLYFSSHQWCLLFYFEDLKANILILVGVLNVSCTLFSLPKVCPDGFYLGRFFKETITFSEMLHGLP